MAVDPKDMRELGRKLFRVAKATANGILDRISIYAADNIITPGDLDSDPDPKKLTNRRGRLLRAVQGNRTSGFQGAESSRWVRGEGRRLDFGFEIDVPYLPIHEFGGTRPAFSIIKTDKMRRFFWAMFYKTNETKWKAMALKKGGVTIPATTYPKRPVIWPAVDRALGDRQEILDRNIRAEFGI